MKKFQDQEEEQDFLNHLLSIHTIAAGLLESALKNLKLDTATDLTVITRLEKSVNALKRIELLIQKRGPVAEKNDAA